MNSLAVLSQMRLLKCKDEPIKTRNRMYNFQTSREKKKEYKLDWYVATNGFSMDWYNRKWAKTKKKKRNKQTRYRGNPGKLKIQRRRQNPGSAIHVRVCFGAKTLITAPSPRLSFLIYAVGGWCPLAAVWGHGETLLVKSNTGWGFPSTLCNQGPGVRNGVYGHRRVSVFFGDKTFCSQALFY